MAFFRMTVEAVVENAKEIMLSGCWTEALNFLESSLEGISTDECFAILKGDKTIIDDELVENEDTRHKNLLREIYIDGFFDEMGYRYKYVATYSTSFFDKILSGHPNDWYLKENGQKAYLQRFIAKEKEKVFSIRQGLWMIAEEVNKNETPYWFTKMDFPRSAKEMYEQCFPEKTENKRLKEIIATTKKENKNNKEWLIDFRKQHVKNFANDNGFDSIESLQEYLRENVLNSCKDKNVKWKNVLINIENHKKELMVPVELAMAYATKQKEKYWIPISPSGVKMENDSPWHTDLWLALGFTLGQDEYEYDSEAYILFEEVVKIFEKMTPLETDFVILNGNGMKKFEGNVVFETSSKITDKDILVLPNANLKYEAIASKAGLVIVERGSELSHLVIVGKQEALPVLKMENAIKKLKDIKRINVDLVKKKISSIEMP